MNNTTPKVSVIMSVYNGEKYVRGAIDSILEQTFANFELVIIDDCSIDSTPKILQEYNDDRIRILTNERNLGLPTSLNKGIGCARGQYLARMDADDLSCPERLERQVQYLDENSQVHVVGCYVDEISRNDEYLYTRQYRSGVRDVDSLKSDGPGVAHPSVMMRKSSVTGVDSYRREFEFAQDLDLWVRMAEEYGSDFLTIIPEVLLQYRITSNQYTRKQVGDIYASYAGEFVGEEERLRRCINREIVALLEEHSPSNATFQYHYKLGHKLLDQNRRLKSGSHILSSIAANPGAIRGWYCLALLVLPLSLRRRLIGFSSKSS